MTSPDREAHRRAAAATVFVASLLLAALWVAAAGGGGASATADRATYRVPINTASAADLQLLPGVGPALADRIVETRSHIRFRGEDDLMRVKGIGAKTARRIMPFARFE